jgi:hypothetical protein
MEYKHDYDFYVIIDEFGKRTVSFTFHPDYLQKLNYLSGLPEFSSTKSISEIIKAVEKVATGVLNEYYIGAEDALNVKVFMNKVEVEDLIQLFGYDKIDKTEIQTVDFLIFLRNWNSFLTKVESNQIPGIIFQ